MIVFKIVRTKIKKQNKKSMDSAKNQLAERLKSANNILVTVSRNPSVDQLSALLGLTLSLNKLGKHAAAVFSGEVPSTLEFLQPEETIEKNTDSLQDFIIALDKAKADKLRYKVEDDVVRIFITPYKSSITQDDLQFSEGDFNVDVVVALGVHQQEDLDEAITAHGRILHDATVTSINTSVDGGLGSINWHDNQASSLSELVTELVQAVEPGILDNQIATALLTGIVAETDRFRNEKTSSLTMSASAALMSAGANQQLVASKLEEGEKPEISTEPSENQQQEESKESDNADGMLEIEHVDGEEGPKQHEELGNTPPPEPEQAPEPTPPAFPQPEQPAPPQPEQNDGDNPRLVTEAPTLGGTLTANSRPEDMMLSPSTDPMSAPNNDNPILNHGDASPAGFSPAPDNWTPNQQVPTDGTLTDLEKAVNSPHLQQQSAEQARNQIDSAVGDGPIENNPVQALNAQPIGGDSLHQNPMPTNPQDPYAAPQPPVEGQMPAPNDPNAPPPVPPPIPFQFNGNGQNDQQNQQ